jgi:hypothetical protein
VPSDRSREKGDCPPGRVDLPFGMQDAFVRDRPPQASR